MPRAVVSGAAGFIASHICDRLLERGWKVLGLDNLVTGSAGNVCHLKDDPRFELVQHDVSQPLEVEGAVDAVLHFASPASPIDFPSMPIQIVKVGTLGTHNMLGLAKAKGARFLLASTSEVYGDPLVHPQPEGYWGNVNPIGPRGCYDEAKRCAEAFTMAYHRAHGLDTRIIRIFNTFGPRMRLDDGRVIPNFFTQAIAGEPLTVYGDGSQTRSLCYVDDLVAGALAVLDCGDPMPFNIGSQDEVTMLELATIVRRVTGSSSTIEFRPLPQDDPRQRRPDTGRARRILGWQPRMPMEQGLRRTLEYFRVAVS
ncbi:MAG TPA: UDP-glucuronic acid decarboxylase family protein [Candidatus Dormibacteraeota bacterium]